MDKELEITSTRMPADERRHQICQIAMKLFSERGFSGTTTKEIANSAGISEATVFKHFSNKDELYAAILDNKACDQGFIQTRLRKLPIRWRQKTITACFTEWL